MAGCERLAIPGPSTGPSGKVDAVKEQTSHAFVGDATDPKVLEGLGAAEMDAAVVTFGNAFEASVLCVATLHRLGVKTVVARAETPRRADILSAVGASRVIQLEAEMGRRLGQNLPHPADAELQDLASQYRVVPWMARGPLVGQSLEQADLPRRHGLTVLGYRRGRGESPGRARDAAPAAHAVARLRDPGGRHAAAGRRRGWRNPILCGVR